MKKLQVEKTEKKVIAENFENISDDELMKSLEKHNLESLISKKQSGKSIWTKEAKSKFKDEKVARRELRKMQVKFSKVLIVDYKTKQNFLESAKNLKNFYSENLIDFKNFSQVGENGEFYDVIQDGYKTMKVVLKLS